MRLNSAVGQGEKAVMTASKYPSSKGRAKALATANDMPELEYRFAANWTFGKG